MFSLTSNYCRLKWTGQSSDDLAGIALDIGIVTHTCRHDKREVKVSGEYTLVYSEGGLVFSGLERGTGLHF